MSDIKDLALGNEDIDSLLKRIDQLFVLDSGNIPIVPETTAASHNLKIEDLEERGFLPAQINEITIGIRDHLAVERYAKDEYNWMQMRELRLGLQMSLDISLYEDFYFSSAQMREIRLGLLAGIDVTSYASLLYSVTDMQKARNALVAESCKKDPNSFEREIINTDYGITLLLSADCMEATLFLSEHAHGERPVFSVLYHDILDMLSENGICFGVHDGKMKDFLADYTSNSSMVIASGKRPSLGKPGYYETFFRDSLKDTPVELPDGRIDYSRINVAETVNPGQLLARYHPAVHGTSGMTVTGISVEGTLGSDLLPLSCTNVEYREESNEYYATQKGQVFLDETKRALNVRTTYVLNGSINRYNGRLSYDGSIYINGDIQEGSELYATGDIEVKGHVEAASLKSEQNIIIRGGMNAAGNGSLFAGGKVVGDFFEATTIQASGSVEANYFLNCNITTDDKIIAKGSKARILGGTLTAVSGIESRIIDPCGNAKMTMDVGNSLAVDRRILETEDEAKNISNEIETLSTGIQKLCAMFGENVEKNTLYQQAKLAITQKENDLLKKQRYREYLDVLKKKTLFANVIATNRIQSIAYVTINGRTKKISEDMAHALLTPQNIKGDGKNGKK